MKLPILSRVLGLWFGMFFLSSGIVFALTSTYGRLMGAKHHELWLETTIVSRYAASLVVAYALHLVLVHLKVQLLPQTYRHRKGLRKDAILGYRVGFTWFVFLLLLLAVGAQNVILNMGWLLSGSATLIAVLVIATLEHWVWRGWAYSFFREKGNKWTVILLLSFGWSLQRAVFFDLDHWLPLSALFVEAVMGFILVDVLGVGGVWTFYLIWMACLHAVLALPFMTFEVPGLLFVEYTLPATSTLSQQLVTQSLFPAMALFVAFCICFVLFPWARRRLI